MENNDRVPRLQRVIEELPVGFDALRAEARAEGYLFVERLANEWMSDTMRFDRDGEALIAASLAGVLAGIGGLTIELSCRTLCACGVSTFVRHIGKAASDASWLEHCSTGERALGGW